MMLQLIKPLPVIVTMLTTAGILMHDMHIDKATTVAIAVPVIAASTAAASTATATGGEYEKVITQNFHTHVERYEAPKLSSSYRSSLPNMQPPRDDDRKYIQNKKLMFVGGGDTTTSLWPSI